MKIVVNAWSARLGGGKTYLLNLFEHLPTRQDVEWLVYAPADLMLPEDPRVERGHTAWPTTNPLLRTLWEKLVLPGILRRTGASILFCPGGVVATRPPLGCRVVTMFRNMIPFDAQARAKTPFGLQRIRNFLLHGTMLRSMSRADLTIFISDHARQLIETLTAVPHAVTIPHGIGDAFRTHGAAIARPSWLPGGDYLLYVSRFDIYKHQQEVVQAFCSLARDLRHTLRLVLVGEVTAQQRQAVESLAQAQGAAGQVVVTGPVPYKDLPGAYHHAKVNLFASSCENCPNILLEALGAGRPVLSSNTMPMPEFGADAVCYFSPTDPHSLCVALETVLRDPELQKKLAAAAAQRGTSFNWAVAAQTTWQHILALESR